MAMEPELVESAEGEELLIHPEEAPRGSRTLFVKWAVAMTGALGLAAIAVGAVGMGSARASVQSLQQRKLGVGVGWTCTKHTSNGVTTETCKPACFPGEAVAHVERRGDVHLEDLREGDSVLAQSTDGSLGYEPVLGFIHVTHSSAPTNFLTVVHEHGFVRATASHLVFATDATGRPPISKMVAELQPGEFIFAANGTITQPSQVRTIEDKSGTRGLFAPYTASGTIVVDKVLASNYAAPSTTSLPVPHGAAHALFFPARAYHFVGLEYLLAPFLTKTAVEKTGIEVDEMSPVAKFYFKYVQLERVRSGWQSQ